MILVVERHNAREHADLLNDMFRLRARVFRDRLKWNVEVVDGMERDRYDDEDPVYIISTDDHRKKVLGSLRLLPTTGPTLVADFFEDTLPEAAQLTSPSIWECTRFCVDEDYLGRDQVTFASGVLFAALGRGCPRRRHSVDPREFRCKDAPPLPARRMRGGGPRIDRSLRPDGFPRIVPGLGADPASHHGAAEDRPSAARRIA